MRMKGYTGISSGPRNSSLGFTLFEVLVAMVLLGMIATMIYSVLSVGISFTDKGEASVVAMDRELAFLSLLHRQVNGAWYDEKKKRMRIREMDGTLIMVTRSPFLYRSAGAVLVAYRYDKAENIFYYLEKRDFFNPDYDDEDYVPRFADMIALFEPKRLFQLEVDPDSGIVTVLYGEDQFDLVPRSAEPGAVKEDEKK